MNHQTYTQLCTKLYNLQNCLWRSTYGQHISYAGKIVWLYSPKLTYQNPFED